jgi:hypothetical protein
MSIILVTHEQVKPFILNGINKALAQSLPDSEAGIFELMESQASQILFDRTGYSASDKTELLSWCIIPMAYIIQKLAKNQVSSLSPDISDDIEKDYQTALDMIDEHPNTNQDSPTDKSTSFSGLIDSMESW